MDNRESKSKKYNPFLKHQAIQKLIGQCPLCNYQYKTIQAKIIEENEEAQLIYIKCQKCYGSIMVLVLSSGPLISSVGLVTDLTELDIINFKNNQRIVEEDVINLHQIIRTKNFCLNFK